MYLKVTSRLDGNRKEPCDRSRINKLLSIFSDKISVRQIAVVGSNIIQCQFLVFIFGWKPSTEILCGIAQRYNTFYSSHHQKWTTSIRLHQQPFFVVAKVKKNWRGIHPLPHSMAIPATSLLPRSRWQGFSNDLYPCLLTDRVYQEEVGKWKQGLLCLQFKLISSLWDTLYQCQCSTSHHH